MLKSLQSSELIVPFVFCVLLLAGCLFDANAQTAGASSSALQQVGEIALTKGVVTARSTQRSLTTLAKGSPVYLGDIIETASRSFAVIKFSDGGKVTLRPDSRFDINEYSDVSGQEKQSFELLKGGLRAVTGAIGKAKPEQVNYKARNTTIGIRGTTFVIRVCEEGENGCRFTKGLDDQTDIASQQDGENKYADIYIVDRKAGRREQITRRQLQELLQGVYVAVIEGSIRVSTKDWYIDMTAGDKCIVDLDAALTSNRKNDEEVECFIRGQGIETQDVFLRKDVEKITSFNLYDDSEVYVGGEICEIR